MIVELLDLHEGLVEQARQQTHKTTVCFQVSGQHVGFQTPTQCCTEKCKVINTGQDAIQ